MPLALFFSCLLSVTNLKIKLFYFTVNMHAIVFWFSEQLLYSDTVIKQLRKYLIKILKSYSSLVAVAVSSILELFLSLQHYNIFSCKVTYKLN